MMSFGRRRALLLIPLVVGLVFVFRNIYQIKNAISYATRPLWDSPDGPKELIKHYSSQKQLLTDDALCAMHGWTRRTEEVVVWDALLVSSELDLLEVRLNELDGLVDRTFILESNSE